jgi:hypothetical protein
MMTTRLTSAPSMASTAVDRWVAKPRVAAALAKRSTAIVMTAAGLP